MKTASELRAAAELVRGLLRFENTYIDFKNLPAEHGRAIADLARAYLANQQPPPNSVKVRIACGITHEGKYFAMGDDDNTDKGLIREVERTLEGSCGGSFHLCFVEAYASLPEPATVAGEVVE